MVPKKASEFIPLVAKELGLDEEVVDAVVSAYWKDIRIALTELEGPCINVLNFGYFMARRKKLKELEYKYSNFVKERPNVTTFRRYAIIKDTQSRLDKVKNLLLKIEQEDIKKQKVKEKRNAQKTKDNLEES